jgi:hypothetical protein
VSDPPLPPPPHHPPSFSVAGPPPPPPPLRQEYGAQPSALPVAPTAGLRKATIVLFWCTVGASVLVAFAAVNRRSVWDGYREGTESLLDLDDADGVVAAAAVVEIGVGLAALIVLSIWSLRAVRNAKALGATNVSPGLACGGWYIPFGNLVVPFVQLRRAAKHRRRPTSAVSVWQGLTIATFVVSGLFRSMGNLDLAEDADDLTDRLTAQTVLAFVMAALLVASAIVAMRAMGDVDGETAPRI